ncbi:MAG: hypothetical protein II680_12560 [Clostridia bacterium]|nr:hypothetical protein [Clostridia bacterium]
MPDFLIGIDAGGTKTRALAYRADDFTPLPETESRSGPGNLTSDYEGACRSIRKAASDCAEAARAILGGNCLHLSVGAAGFSGIAASQTDADGLTDALLSVSGGRATLVSDAALALHANFAAGETGMIVISGTGSAAFFQSKDNAVLRAGGWGNILGDRGSGWSAAREGAVRLLRLNDSGDRSGAQAFFNRWKEAHRRGPAADRDFFDNCSVGSIIDFVMRRPKKDLSVLACGLVSLYEEGDPVCREILGGEMEALASDCARLLKAAGLGDPSLSPALAVLPAVLTGGFFESNPSVRALFRERLAALPDGAGAVVACRENPADPTRAVVRHYLESVSRKETES